MRACATRHGVDSESQQGTYSCAGPAHVLLPCLAWVADRLRLHQDKHDSGLEATAEEASAIAEAEEASAAPQTPAHPAPLAQPSMTSIFSPFAAAAGPAAAGPAAAADESSSPEQVLQKGRAGSTELVAVDMGNGGRGNGVLHESGTPQAQERQMRSRSAGDIPDKAASSRPQPQPQPQPQVRGLLCLRSQHSSRLSVM